MPSAELKDLYRQAAQTEVEHKIVQVLYDSPPIGASKDPGNAGAVIHNELVDLLGTWRKLLGSSRNLQVTSEQLLLEVNFIVKYYGTTTLAEIEWMMQLVVTRRLKMTYPDFPSFNVDYFIKVIQAFWSWKFQEGERMRLAVQVLRDQQRAATMAVRVDTIRWQIKMVKEGLDQEKLAIFQIPDVYLFLTRTGRIGEGGHESPEAASYADEKVKRLKQTWYSRRPENRSLREVLKGPDPDQMDQEEELRQHEGFRKEYCLIGYFQRVDLKDILDQVSEKDFGDRL